MVRKDATNWSNKKWTDRTNRTGISKAKNPGISKGRKENATSSKKLRSAYKCVTGKFGVFCNTSKGANTKNYNKFNKPKAKPKPKKAPVKKAPPKPKPKAKPVKKAPVKKSVVPEKFKGMNRQQYLNSVKVVLVKDLTKEQKKIYNKLEKAPRIRSSGLRRLKRTFNLMKYGGKDMKKVEPKAKPVKKAPVKKAPKKAPVKKAPVKKEPVKKAPAKKEIELTKEDIDSAMVTGWTIGDMGALIFLQNDRKDYDNMAKFIEKQIKKNKPVYVNLISSFTKRYNDMIIEKKGAKKWLEGLEEIVRYIDVEGEAKILNPLLKGEVDKIPKGAIKQRNKEKVFKELGLN